MDAHLELTLSMQKEIELMREMLANLHQEELSLLMHDKANWSLLMQERSILIERLSALRLRRIEATKKIDMIASGEKFLSLGEEISSEIFTLRDQMMALIERTNLQSSQNETLYEQVGNLLGTPSSMAERQGQPLPKKKASVATYNLKR
jgi:hypothetical protein